MSATVFANTPALGCGASLLPLPTTHVVPQKEKNPKFKARLQVGRQGVEVLASPLGRPGPGWGLGAGGWESCTLRLSGRGAGLTVGQPPGWRVCRHGAQVGTSTAPLYPKGPGHLLSSVRWRKTLSGGAGVICCPPKPMPSPVPPNMHRPALAPLPVVWLHACTPASLTLPPGPAAAHQHTDTGRGPQVGWGGVGWGATVRCSGHAG